MLNEPGARKMPRLLPVILAALLIVSVLGLGTASPASAAAPLIAGEKAVVTNTDGDPIRIRRGAGTEFAAFAFAYQGQSVRVLEGPRNDKSGITWFRVQAPAGTGWMMAEFLEGDGTAPAAPRLTGTARVANTNGDPLRMRSAPSASGSVLTLLSPGATVTVHDGPTTDSSGISWYKVSAKGFTGWVMSQYLAQVEPQAQAPRQTQAQPQATAVPAAKKEAPPQAERPVARQAGATTTLGQYRQWMEEARVQYPYPQSVDKMWAVMMCESGGNPRASGGGGRWLGLFQYAPGTWGGSWNPYRGESIWDARSQIFASAKAWSIGMQSHWSCYYKTAGR